ncbi:MAG: AAA family ATPase [Candidatus Acetothermia bacterium]|jgi:hypothetical protein|nr:AAA family ATPase [Candidatus Acetothermia bacterium]MDH7505583.1 AAA family ATPase [Candidatus Acetothermia bacterium]
MRRIKKSKSIFEVRLEEHFGVSPLQLPVLSEEFESHDHVNLQVALDAWLSVPGRTSELLGIRGADGWRELTITDLLRSYPPQPEPGPVQYANIQLEEGRVVTCIKEGLLFLRDGKRALVALVSINGSPMSAGKVRVQVMARSREDAGRFLGEIRTSMRERNVYRGRIISLETDFRSLKVKLHQLPPVSREGIILPEGLLERIERHTIGFARQAEHLRAAGRHLKRGLLLHGRPGTGKTLTATYLANAMKGRTVFLVTGLGQGLVAYACRMARALAPATIIIEDVDLIGRDREIGCTSPLLYELLNEMDGLADDADILFILTTNRPHVIEPALASRPGRIDLAIELPLPDPECRRRLFQLYSRGLPVERADWEPLIPKTDGASAAFIRELLRTAALFAAEAGHPSRVDQKDLEEALRELTIRGGLMTRRVLGFHTEEATAERPSTS